MSALRELLLEAGGVELRWNVTGVDPAGRVSPDKFAIRLFTVDHARGLGGFDAPLAPEHIIKLYNFLEPFCRQLDSEHAPKLLRVVETGEDVESLIEALNALEPAARSRALAALVPRDKLDWVAENLSEVEGEELEAALRHSRRRKALESLKMLVEEDVEGDVVSLCRRRDELEQYRAGKPETVFQRWFEANVWVLGREYVRRHPLRVIGLDSEADLVMETTDGYLDVVELKRPRCRLLTSHRGAGGDEGGAGFHYLHSELSQAYGQCVRYLRRLDEFRYQLEEQFNCRIVAPRIYLVAGRNPPDGSEEADDLRRVVASFHRIEIFSYDQIIRFGERLLSKSEPGC